MKKALLTLLFLTIAAPLFAKELVIFTGIPEVKISEGGISRLPENLTKDDPWELTTGPWTIELWQGDRKLISQSFTVFKP